MSLLKIPIASGSYKHKSVDFDSQRCINFYPEFGSTGSISRKVLLRTPGLLLFTTASGVGAVRGMYTSSSNRLFVVVGTVLNEVSTSGVVTNRATLLTNFGMVSMVDDGTTLVIVDGSFGYSMILTTNVFAQIADADFPNGARICGFVDGYITAFKPGTTPPGRWQISDLYNATVWDGLDVFTAEGNPDQLVSMIVNGRDVWLMGANSTEVFYDTGAANNTFARIPGAFIEIGCAATHSVSKMNGSVFWLGANKEGHSVIYRSNGYNAVRISDNAIEADIDTYADQSDAVGYCYQQDGHSFYVLSFQTGNRTWCFDLSTGEWHEREYRDPLTGVPGRHRAIAHAFFNGKNYVGDYANGKIYEYSLTTYTDNLDIMVSERTFPHFTDMGQRISWHSLEMMMQSGVGLTTGQGSDPKIILAWSDDGGNTYGNNHQKSIGAIGQYGKRVKWNRLGVSRDRVYKVSVSDPVEVVIFDDVVADVEAE